MEERRGLEASSANESKTLLSIKDMRVYYSSVRGEYKVVDGVSFDVFNNEVIGLAGESGCGKSTLVEGLLRLIVPPGHIPSGEVFAPHITEGITQNVELLSMREEEFRQIRWSKISYIPQGSMSSLNPIMKVRDQIADVIQTHSPMSKERVNERIEELLTSVGLQAEVAGMYPHELSGGMKQRVIIGMAIALNPDLIIADEPTTALDVTIQRVIIQTLAMIRKQFGSTIMLVSHDMPVHAQLDDRMVIMYAGKVMEIGSTDEIFHDALHPYTDALISTIPSISEGRRKLEGIPGVAPSPLEWPAACRYHPRCPRASEHCAIEEPTLLKVAPGRFVACHLYGDQGDELISTGAPAAAKGGAL